MPTTDLQIDWLRAFVTVVDAGSLSAAAPLVHRSQSAVSMQIRKLEDAVGRPVLSRSPRRLELTPAGATLLGHARRLLEVHHEAVDALGGAQLSGRIRVGVPDDFASMYFTPVLRHFASQHGGVEIELCCEQSTALVPKVRSGEVDLALVSQPRAGVGTLLFREPLVWVGAPQHEVWRRAPLPVALYEPGSLARKHALAALAARRIAHRIVYKSASLAGQLAAVESGLAIAVLTQCSVPAGLQILQARHGLPPVEPVEVVLMRSKASERDAAVDAMRALIVRTLRREA